MNRQRSAANYFPSNPNSLNELRKAAANCKGCDLYRAATQTVFGDGSAKAKIMFVGEQPGDKEDLQGKPFVGPAGKLLDSALEEAGIDKSAVYVTNAVKHFSFEQRGKRRLHKKPKAVEINACRPWLEAEVNKIKPQTIVCLGATAFRSIFGKVESITKFRGQFLASDFSKNVLITVHPSSILRMTDSTERQAAFKLFVKDLKKLVKLM